MRVEKSSSKRRRKIWIIVIATLARPANEGEIGSHETLPSVHLLSWIVTVGLLLNEVGKRFWCIKEEGAEAKAVTGLNISLVWAAFFAWIFDDLLSSPIGRGLRSTLDNAICEDLLIAWLVLTFSALTCVLERPRPASYSMR